MRTTETPSTKLMVSACPNREAEARAVKMVAMVDEYFFRIASAATQPRHGQSEVAIQTLNTNYLIAMQTSPQPPVH